MKRILFTSTAGTGHFTPMVALAKEFIKEGHQVKVAAPESFRAEVEKNGFEFLPFDDVAKDDPRVGEVFAKMNGQPLKNMHELVGKVVFGLTNTEAALPKMATIIEEFSPDLIISETAELSAAIIAKQKNIPYVRFGVGLASSDIWLIKYATEGTEPLLKEYDLDSDDLFNYLVASIYLTYFPESLEDPAYPQPKGKTLRLIPPSIENGATQEKHVDTTPLGYVTFGTVASQLGFYPRIIQQIMDSLRDLPVKAIITIGNKADPKELENIPENVEVAQWIDQEEVLKKATMVICHVGSGTMIGCLAFGLPIIAVPLFADQFANAERLEAIHAGIKVDTNEQLPEKIKESITNILEQKLNTSQIAEEMTKKHTRHQDAVNKLLTKVS